MNQADALQLSWRGITVDVALNQSGLSKLFRHFDCVAIVRDFSMGISEEVMSGNRDLPLRLIGRFEPVRTNSSQLIARDCFSV